MDSLLKIVIPYVVKKTMDVEEAGKETELLNNLLEGVDIKDATKLEIVT